jgi:hypothetical protein
MLDTIIARFAASLNRCVLNMTEPEFEWFVRSYVTRAEIYDDHFTIDLDPEDPAGLAIGYELLDKGVFVLRKESPMTKQPGGPVFHNDQWYSYNFNGNTHNPDRKAVSRTLSKKLEKVTLEVFRDKVTSEQYPCARIRMSHNGTVIEKIHGTYQAKDTTQAITKTNIFLNTYSDFVLPSELKDQLVSTASLSGQLLYRAKITRPIAWGDLKWLIKRANMGMSYPIANMVNLYHLGMIGSGTSLAFQREGAFSKEPWVISLRSPTPSRKGRLNYTTPNDSTIIPAVSFFWSHS